MNMDKLKAALHEMLNATLSDDGKSISLFDQSLEFTLSSDDKSDKLDITAPKESIGLKAIIEKQFPSEMQNFNLLRDLLNGPLSDIGLKSIELEIPTDQDITTPIVTFNIGLTSPLHICTLGGHSIDIPKDVQLSFTTYAFKLDDELNFNSLISLSCHINSLNVDALLSSQNATTWQLLLSNDNSDLQQLADTLSGELPTPVSGIINRASELLSRAGMNRLHINSILLAVDFTSGKLLDLSVTGNVYLDKSSHETPDKSKSLEFYFNLASKTLSGCLTAPVEIPLENFIPSDTKTELDVRFPNFDFSLNLESEELFAEGSVQLLCKQNSLIQKIAKVMGLYSSGKDDNALAMSLGINVSKNDFSLSFSCGPTDPEAQSCSLYDLVDDISPCIAGELGVVKDLPKLSLPKLQLTYQSDGDFDISVTSQINDIGELFIQIDKQSENDIDLSFGIAFSDINNIDQIISGYKCPLPACLVIQDVYLVFSTTGKSFTFPSMNSPISFDQMHCPIQNPNFAIGMSLSYDDTVPDNSDPESSGDSSDNQQNTSSSSCPSKVFDQLFKHSPSLFANGAIGLNPFLFGLEAGVECGGDQLNIGKFGAGLDVVDYSMVLGDNGFTMGFDLWFDFKIESQDIICDARIDLMDNEVQVSGTMLGVIEESYKNTLNQYTAKQLAEMRKSSTLSYQPLSIDIADYKIDLHDCAIMISDSYELEEPGVGFTAQIGFYEYDIMIALLLDSGDPQTIMFAASMGRTNLSEIIERLCWNFSDKEGNTALNAISNANVCIDGSHINDTAAITNMSDIAESLNSRQLPEVVSSILEQYDPTLDTKKLAISYGEKLSNDNRSATWYLTDTRSARIYQLSWNKDKNDNNILSIDNEIQLYLAPEDIMIGQVHFNKGVRIDGKFSVYDFAASIHAELDSNGLNFSALCNPVHFPSKENSILQFIRSADTSDQGPEISFNTNMNKNVTPPPGLHIDGYLSIFDANGEVKINIDEEKLNGSLTLQDTPEISAAINFTTKDWSEFLFQAKINIDLDLTIPAITLDDGTPILPENLHVMNLKFDYMEYFTPPHTKANKNPDDYNLQISVGKSNNTLMLNGGLLWNGSWIYTFNTSDKLTITSVKNVSRHIKDWVLQHVQKVFGSLKHDLDKYWVCFCNDTFSFGNYVVHMLWQFYSNETNAAEAIVVKLKSYSHMTGTMYRQCFHVLRYHYQQTMEDITQAAKTAFGSDDPETIITNIAQGEYALVQSDSQQALNLLYQGKSATKQAMDEYVNIYKNVFHITDANTIFKNMSVFYGNSHSEMSQAALVIYHHGLCSLKSAYNILHGAGIKERYLGKDMLEAAKSLGFSIKNWKSELGSLWKKSFDAWKHLFSGW